MNEKRPLIGLTQPFAVGDFEAVEKALLDLRRLKVDELKTEVRWRDAQTAEGQRWYRWLFERLSRELKVVPSFREEPIPNGEGVSHAVDLHSFVDDFLGRFGGHLEWVAIELDAEELAWEDAAELGPKLSRVAQTISARGKRALLSGIDVERPQWLERMIARGWLQSFEAIGVQRLFERGRPERWEVLLAPIQKMLETIEPRPELWIADSGCAASELQEGRQLAAFADAVAAPVERLYWRTLRDVEGESRTERFGLKRTDGTEKLLYRLWAQDGLEGVALPSRREGHRVPAARGPKAVIFGGAGFIGSNLANKLLESGRPVRVFDNLSRPGVEKNLRWLKERHGDRLELELADVRDASAVRRAVDDADQVFNFAAQVAVTTSLTAPVHDFEVNARGALNVLEAIRARRDRPTLLFTSTNKVYGGLLDLALEKRSTRYEPEDPEIAARGISELRSLEFESPYGCSKGAADQYVVDYARSYGLKTVVFRMSCIYGPRQFGTEDQGWVAHFLIRALEGQPITLYGDGHQVRDILFVEDLVRAFLLAKDHIDQCQGQAFNIGGGPQRTVSLLEVLDTIGQLVGERPRVHFEEWRTGDQRYYVSDTRKFGELTGWAPRVGVEEGIRRLFEWLSELRGGRVERAPQEAEVRA